MTQLRRATLDDLETIASFPQNKHDLFLFAPTTHYPLTQNQLEQTLNTRLHNSVLELDGEIIGFANFYDYLKGDCCFIGNVIINPKYRGQGYGRDLMQRMIFIAFDELGFREVRISVFEFNKPAFKLYKRLGFVFYNSEVRTDPDGQDVLLLHMKCDYQSYIKQLYVQN